MQLLKRTLHLITIGLLAVLLPLCFSASVYALSSGADPQTAAEQFAVAEAAAPRFPLKEVFFGDTHVLFPLCSSATVYAQPTGPDPLKQTYFGDTQLSWKLSMMLNRLYIN